MSDRERWIVYPLLFLALSLGVRDRLIPSDVTFREIKCQRLLVGTADCGQVIARDVSVNSAEGDARVRIGSTTARSGTVQIFGPRQPASEGSRPDSIMAIPPTHPALLLVATERGGVVRAVSHDGLRRVVLGHESESAMSGLLAIDDKGRLVARRTSGRRVPWGFPLFWKPRDSAKPKAEQPAKKEAAAPSDQKTASPDAGGGKRPSPNNVDAATTPKPVENSAPDGSQPH